MLHPMPKTSVRHKIHYSNSSPRKNHHDNQQVVVEVEDKNFYQLIEEHKKQLKLQVCVSLL
jgi:hypothetical protein